jgi:hypothetical protein
MYKLSTESPHILNEVKFFIFAVSDMLHQLNFRAFIIYWGFKYLKKLNSSLPSKKT